MQTIVEQLMQMHLQDANDLEIEIVCGNELVHRKSGIKTWRELGSALAQGAPTNRYNYVTLHWHYPREVVLSLCARQAVLAWNDRGPLYVASSTLELTVARDTQRSGTVAKASIEQRQLRRPSGLATLCQGFPVYQRA